MIYSAIWKSLIKAELPIGTADAPLNISYLSRTIREIVPQDTSRATKAVSNLVCMTEQLQPWRARILAHQRCWRTRLVWWSGLGHQARHRLPTSVLLPEQNSRGASTVVVVCDTLENFTFGQGRVRGVQGTEVMEWCIERSNEKFRSIFFPVLVSGPWPHLKAMKIRGATSWEHGRWRLVTASSWVGIIPSGRGVL